MRLDSIVLFCVVLYSTLLSLTSFEHNTFEIQSYWFVYQHSFFIISSSIVVWIDHYLFFHSPVVGYLDCFQLGAIINKSAINTIVSPLDKYVGLKILGHRLDMFSLLAKYHTDFQTGFCNICEFQLLHILASIWCCQSKL